MYEHPPNPIPPWLHAGTPSPPKAAPGTFIPLALVALGARGGNSQDPTDGVGRAGGVGADRGHLGHGARGGCKARPSSQRAGQDKGQPAQRPPAPRCGRSTGALLPHSPLAPSSPAHSSQGTVIPWLHHKGLGRALWDGDALPLAVGHLS